MVIEVTQDDIDQGIKNRDDFRAGRKTLWCSSCPVALALRRQVPNAMVGVGWRTVSLTYNGYDNHEYLLPEIAVKFIRKVDDCLDDQLQPFVFEATPSEYN